LLQLACSIVCLRRLRLDVTLGWLRAGNA
jgi:hypothetical protein